MMYYQSTTPAATAEQAHTLTILNLVFGSASMLCSGFVIGAYIAFPTLRNLPSRLVMLLCLSDLIFALAHVSHFNFAAVGVHRSAACTVQAFVINFAGISSMLWSSIIAFSIYYTVYLARRELERKVRLFAAVAYAVPFCLSLLPLAFDAYALNQGWCYIAPARARGEREDACAECVPFGVAVSMYVIDFYAPLLACFIASCVFIVTALRRLKEQSHKDYLAVRKLMAYPFILPACWLPGVIRRIVDLNDAQEYHFAAAVAHVCFSLSVGIVNACVYGINHNLCAHLRALVCAPQARPSADLTSAEKPQSTTSEVRSMILDSMFQEFSENSLRRNLGEQQQKLYQNTSNKHSIVDSLNSAHDSDDEPNENISRGANRSRGSNKMSYSDLILYTDSI